MVRHVATRWNSLADAIGRAIELRPAIDKLLGLTKYDKPGKAGLRRYKLSDEEWKILIALYPLLEVWQIRWFVAMLLLSLTHHDFA